MSDHIRVLLDECKTAKEAWDLLRDQYASRCSGSVLEWFSLLTSIRMQNDESIEEYIARAMQLKHNLAAAGFDIDDREVSMHLLAGLPNATYGSVKISILPKMLKKSTAPMLDAVIDSIIVFQGLAGMLGKQPEEPIKYAAVAAAAGPFCKYCKAHDHNIDKCPVLAKKNKKQQQQQQQGYYQQQHGRNQQQQPAGGLACAAVDVPFGKFIM
jgi:hypothetical protein